MLLITWVKNRSLTLAQAFGIYTTKFLQFDRPGAEVFQMSFRYQKSQSNLVMEVTKEMAERFQDFEIQEMQELKKFEKTNIPRIESIHKPQFRSPNKEKKIEMHTTNF